MSDNDETMGNKAKPGRLLNSVREAIRTEQGMSNDTSTKVNAMRHN